MRASSGHWRLTQLTAISWVQLPRHSQGLQRFLEPGACPKSPFLLRDIFKSWAGPCISELPVLHQIKVHLHLLSSARDFSGLCKTLRAAVSRLEVPILTVNHHTWEHLYLAQVCTFGFFLLVNYGTS